MQPPAIPDLSGFPMWAQVMVYGILGISVAVTFIFTWLGFLKGKENSPGPSSTNAAQVAAVIVDPTALLKAVDAVNTLSRQVDELTDAIKSHTLEIVRSSGQRH